MFNVNTDDIGLPQVQALYKDWQGGIVIFVALLLGVELLLRTFEWWTARKEGRERNLLPNDAIVNLLTTSVYNLTLRGFGYAAMFGVGFVGYNMSHWRIPLNWWTLPAYILAAEFWSYFFHRLMHEMRLFWADHSVHHSSEEFDFTTFQRFHLFEWVPKVIVFLPLTMMGFHPFVLFLFTSLAGIQLMCHTARFGRWGWWDKWFVSPTIHGVHHARNPIYMDRNLGGALNLWDHVFGTYQNATDERLVYGVTHSPRHMPVADVPSWSYVFQNPGCIVRHPVSVLMLIYPIKALFWEYTFLGRDLVHAPTWKDKVIVLFGRPGETFEAPPKVTAQHGISAPAGQLAPAAPAGMPADAVAA